MAAASISFVLNSFFFLVISIWGVQGQNFPAGSLQNIWVSVKWGGDAYALLPRATPFTAGSFESDELAVGRYNETFEQIGWSTLEVHTNPQYEDEAQAEAAGFFEGVVTAERIWQYSTNFDILKPLHKKIEDFVKANDEFMKEKIRLSKDLPFGDSERIYWWHVHLVLTQLDAVHKGYENVSSPGQEITKQQILLNQLMGGDLFDIEDALRDPSSDSTKRPQHCSGLLRLLGNNSDIFISQITWAPFETMMRIFKLYDMPYTLDGKTAVVPAQRVSFSSYPGSLFSGDDYYLLSSGLVVQETTIGYDNPELNKFVVNTTVLEWLRNIVANRLSSSGYEWTQVYAKYNSGTYNNQNMILDYKLFVPGKPLVNNTFWLCEQIPGYIISHDLSQMLETNRYYGSYNAAFDPQIRALSGADNDVSEGGLLFTYDRCPRALIFARDVHNVVDMDSMKRMMRSNNFPNDPLSTQLESCFYLGMTNCTPTTSCQNAIACRGDLCEKDGIYAQGLGLIDLAAIDGKISSFSTYDPLHLSTQAISGPTNDQLPTFVFSQSPFKHLSWVGMPDVWDFPWVTIEW